VKLGFLIAAVALQANQSDPMSCDEGVEALDVITSQLLSSFPRHNHFEDFHQVRDVPI